MAWVAALRLVGVVEMEVVGVESSVGTGAFFALGWGLAVAEVLVAVVPLFLTGYCCFDVEPSAFGVAFVLEVDARAEIVTAFRGAALTLSVLFTSTRPFSPLFSHPPLPRQM